MINFTSQMIGTCLTTRACNADDKCWTKWRTTGRFVLMTRQYRHNLTWQKNYERCFEDGWRRWTAILWHVRDTRLFDDYWCDHTQWWCPSPQTQGMQTSDTEWHETSSAKSWSVRWKRQTSFNNVKSMMDTNSRSKICPLDHDWPYIFNEETRVERLWENDKLIWMNFVSRVQRKENLTKDVFAQRTRMTTELNVACCVDDGWSDVTQATLWRFWNLITSSGMKLTDASCTREDNWVNR